MATLDEMVAEGVLERLEVDLDVGEQTCRLIYATERCIRWLSDTLPDMESALNDAIAPYEQFEALMSAYIRGGELAATMQFRKMRPVGQHIWELKSTDLRIFGWFYRPCVFIASAIDDASRVKDFDLYRGYRDQAVRDRTELGFDPPLYVEGEDYADVL